MRSRADYSPHIAGRTRSSRLDWRAIIAGVAIAAIVALLAQQFLASFLLLAATILGIGCGAFVAGKWADSAGLQHGVMVGVGYVVCEAIGIAPSPNYTSDVLADTAIVIGLDVVMLLVASVAGWLARPGPWSSSDTGRGR